MDGLASNRHFHCQFKIVTVIAELEMTTSVRVFIMRRWCCTWLMLSRSTRTGTEMSNRVSNCCQTGVLYRYAIECTILWKSCFISHAQFALYQQDEMQLKDWPCLHVVLRALPNRADNV